MSEGEVGAAAEALSADSCLSPAAALPLPHRRHRRPATQRRRNDRPVESVEIYVPSVCGALLTTVCPVMEDVLNSFDVMLQNENSHAFIHSKSY